MMEEPGVPAEREEAVQIVLVAVASRFKPLACRIRLPLVIGRGGDLPLTVPDRLISRRHCRLSWSNGQVVVEDLGSLNGTYVGTERVTKSVCPYGELLTIGPLTFRVEPADAEPAGVTWCSAEEFAAKLCDPSSIGMKPPQSSAIEEKGTPPSGGDE